jgi:hypothetical protein
MAVSCRECNADCVSDRELPKLVWPTLIVLPAIPIIGLGLVHVEQSAESWTGLVPFALTAAFAVTFMLVGYRFRDMASTKMAQPQWPATPWQFRSYVAVLAMLPLAVLAGAVVALVNQWWLPAAVFIAMAIPPTLLNTLAIQMTWRNRQGRQASSEAGKGSHSDV